MNSNEQNTSGDKKGLDDYTLSRFSSVAFTPCNENTLGEIIETIVKPEKNISITMKLKRQNDSLGMYKSKGFIKKVYTYELNACSTGKLGPLLKEEYPNILELNFNLANGIPIIMRTKKYVPGNDDQPNPTMEILFSGIGNDMKNSILKVLAANFKGSRITAIIMTR